MSRLRRMHRGTRCVYCGIVLRRNGANNGNFATRDHITPRAQGGAGQGIAICCYECNQAKASLTLSEWRGVYAVRFKRLFFHYEKIAVVLALRLTIIRCAELAVSI